MLDLKADRERIDSMERAGKSGALADFARLALLEIERLRAPVDVEGAAIAAWCACGGPCDTVEGWAAAHRDSRDRYRGEAYAVLVYAGRAPAARPITDEVIDEAARCVLAVQHPGKAMGDMMIWAQRQCREEARIVLEYAASLGGVMSAPVADAEPAAVAKASRRYALPIGETRPILCTSYGMTEEQVIHRLLTALDALASDLQRCVEESRAEPAQPGPSVEERLMRYRCAGLIGLMPRDLDEPTSAAIAERQAHAMLAAEKAVLT